MIFTKSPETEVWISSIFIGQIHEGEGHFHRGKMSLTIGSSSYHTAPETKCNLLPCTISKDGDANVTRYFETSVRKENGGEFIFFLSQFL